MSFSSSESTLSSERFSGLGVYITNFLPPILIAKNNTLVSDKIKSKNVFFYIFIIFFN
jgi:uncharacterized membrane protein